METIIDSRGYRYMSEFMTDLPDNVMINKVLTGCGGTTVALSNNVPYVICVPFRSMIINKLKWAKENSINICPVMGGTSDDDIRSFKGNKFVVTYDSLGRLPKLIDSTRFKILIDESHKLIDSGSFRGDAIRTVLANFQKFKFFVFMTATPVKDKYNLPELIKIPKVKIQWYGIKPVEIKYTLVTSDLNEAIAFIAAKHLSGEIDSNAHIFINSVTSIIDVIETIDINLISPESINIICANNEENQEKISNTIGSKYTIKNVGEVSKINLYTSTAFEGSDIYDTNGKIYIVTDGKKDYTKNDILTTLPQIIGRVRDTKYCNKIDLLYSSSSYYNDFKDEAEFEYFVKDKLAQAENLVETYNSNDDNPMVKNALYKDAETNRYILQKDNNLIVNDTALYNEMHSYDSVHCTYYAFENDFSDGNFTLDVNDTIHNYFKQEPQKVDGYHKLLIRKKPNFESLCITYLEVSCSKETKLRIDVHEPLIKQAYEELGAEKMKALRYEKKLIKNELIKVKALRTYDWKIVSLLEYRVGQFLTSAKIKRDLSNAYKTLGIVKTAKATDLRNWYEIKSQTRRDKNTNILERGYKIVICNIKTTVKDNKVIDKQSSALAISNYGFYKNS